MAQRAPYAGNTRRLVIAMDLGTTFSGVSFALLDPGHVPEIQTVQRYPGQETRDAKIPTVIWYDRHGEVAGVGDDAPDDDGEGDDEDAPVKVQWFKLLLRPETTSSPDVPSVVLPPFKTLEAVYADFYHYLFTCAQKYIQESFVALGSLVWDSVKDNIDFVLSHPNGWGGPQQQLMRSAAVKAGLAKDKDSQTRITFVTEGEASMHFCLANKQLVDSLKTGDSAVIIDAGGGTIDLSAYRFDSVKPLKAIESALPICLFDGSVIVTHRAKRYTQTKLESSAFGAKTFVSAIADMFDKTAKKRFKGSGDVNIKFSHSVKDTDHTVGIRSGRIKFGEMEMRGFFDPSIDKTIAAIRGQLQATNSSGKVGSFLLVGGFAASEYLYERLKAFLSEQDMPLYRPDASPNKAVAEGAVAFLLDHVVSARMARFTFGTPVSMPALPLMFMPRTPQVRARLSTMYRSLDGEPYLPGAFAEILQQGVLVSETQEFRKGMSLLRRPGTGFKAEAPVMAYRGSSAPMFVDEDPEAFFTLGEVEANLKKAPRSKSTGPAGDFFTIDVEMVLSFGLTEFKAEIAWKDKNDVERRSPAKVLYEPDYAVNVTDG